MIIDRFGNSIPVLFTDTANAVDIDGTLAHAESGKLEAGMYRLAVVSSTDDLGVRIDINTDPTAVASEGIFMPNGAIEYFAIEADHIVSVLAGILNITKLS